MCDTNTLFDTNTLLGVRHKYIDRKKSPNLIRAFLFRNNGGKMQEKGMYFGTKSIYEKIRSIGGEWNDGKERPIVCLIESTEKKGLFWAIPVGNWNHRDLKAQARIQNYLALPDRNLASCYYHIGNTTTKSIFFISDVIPITESYIERDYLGYDKKLFVIKNKILVAELERKLKRILAYEVANQNYFRQHITDLKNELIKELDS